MNWKKNNRKIHYWAAVACAIPIVIVIVTGVLLLLKKEFSWIQPSTVKTEAKIPTIEFSEVIGNLKQQSGILSWKQIDRIDVRPSKGVMKIQLYDSTEVQMHIQTGEILNIAVRRSDLIESIHDGSFFHDKAKLWLFLPSAVLLLILWITGIYLFVITEFAKRRSRNKKSKINNNNALETLATKA